MAHFLSFASEQVQFYSGSQWLVLSAIVFGASVLRGLVGFGFAVATVSLFGVVLPPSDAVLLSVLLQVSIGLWDGPMAIRTCDWPSLRPLILGVAGATPLGLLALHWLPGPTARAVLALTAMTVLGLIMKPSFARRFQAGASPLAVGCVAGVLNGLAAMPGPPVVAYFMNHAITPAVARASLIVFFGIAATVAALNAMLTGLIEVRLVLAAMSVLPALLLGSMLGTRLFALASPQFYRLLALAVLTLSVAVAVWNSLADFGLP